MQSWGEKKIHTCAISLPNWPKKWTRYCSLEILIQFKCVPEKNVYGIVCILKLIKTSEFSIWAPNFDNRKKNVQIKVTLNDFDQFLLISRNDTHTKFKLLVLKQFSTFALIFDVVLNVYVYIFFMVLVFDFSKIILS